jgi:hypothetical protein
VIQEKAASRTIIVDQVAEPFLRSCHKDLPKFTLVLP